MPRVAYVGGHKIFQLVFIHMLRSRMQIRIAIIFDVHPANAWFHCLILLERLRRVKALADNVGSVEDRDHCRVVYFAMQLGKQLPGLADEIRFDF